MSRDTVHKSIAYAAWTALLTFAGAHLVAHLTIGESGAGVILAPGAAAYALSATHVGRVGGSVVVPPPGLGVVGGDGGAGTTSSGRLPVCPSRGDPVRARRGRPGVRTPASATLALTQLGGNAAVMMTARTAATQVGYLLGAAAGGPIIAVLGYPALGSHWPPDCWHRSACCPGWGTRATAQPRVMAAAAAARPARPVTPSLA